MKEFEKEWEHTLLQDKHKVIAEAYWRAALKTLKEKCYCAGMYGEKGSCELVDWINKELEEN